MISYYALVERLRPLSPYKTRKDLPSYRLFARTTDNFAHGLWRVAFMAQWALFAAVLCSIGNLAGGTTVLALDQTAICVGALLVWKVAGMPLFHYGFDPLDWVCDAVVWGGAGAYTTAALFAHHLPAPLVYVLLGVAWAFTYPWSTPA